MNAKLKKNLVTKIKKLKKLGLSGIKLSLEDEGSSFNDLERMKKITKSLKIDLNIKIGGCEAKNDIIFCKSLSPNSIVAPMVESEYALKKFIQSVGNKKKIKLLINLESISAIKNISKFLRSKYFRKLDGVVIGRSDLAGSLNLSKKEVNNDVIFKKIFKTITKIKKRVKSNFLIKMGGSITPKSKNFIDKLYKSKLINRIETRNVELKLNNNIIENIEKIIPEIFKFELEWLKIKLILVKNKMLSKEFKIRVRELEERLSR